MCLIPWLTAANFSHILINLLQPLNPAKYIVFTTTDRQINSLPNKLAIFQINSAQYPVTARVAVAYFREQSCLHIIISYLAYGRLKPNKIWHICVTAGQYEIPQKYRHSVETGKFRGPAQNSAFSGKLVPTSD